jgi:hypothetical protein
MESIRLILVLLSTISISIAVPSMAQKGATRGEPTAASRVINRYWESHKRKAFQNHICTIPASRSPARAVRHVFSIPHTIGHRPTMGGVGHVSVELVVARRVLPDRRKVAVVGVCGVQPGVPGPIYALKCPKW